LVPRDGIEPPSLPCKSRALPLDERGINLAGHEGIEPPPTVSKTVMISISPMAVLLGESPGNRTPICGFGDRRNAIIPETQIWSTG
jgi:hypothetical protein